MGKRCVISIQTLPLIPIDLKLTAVFYPQRYHKGSLRWCSCLCSNRTPWPRTSRNTRNRKVHHNRRCSSSCRGSKIPLREMFTGPKRRTEVFDQVLFSRHVFWAGSGCACTASSRICCLGLGRSEIRVHGTYPRLSRPQSHPANRARVFSAIVASYLNSVKPSPELVTPFVKPNSLPNCSNRPSKRRYITTVCPHHALLAKGHEMVQPEFYRSSFQYHP